MYETVFYFPGNGGDFTGRNIIINRHDSICIYIRRYRPLRSEIRITKKYAFRELNNNNLRSEANSELLYTL